MQTELKNGEVLKERLGIDVSSINLDLALQHSSYINSNIKSNEEYNISKIESFAGKQLIEVFCNLNFLLNNSIDTYKLFPSNKLVSIAETIDDYYNIRELIYLSDGEKLNPKKYYIEIIYRLIFKIYREIGFDKTYNFLLKFLSNDKTIIDYKTMLQEYVQSKKETVIYEIISESGPPNDKVFEAKVIALNKEVTAFGKSKKLAEKEAARKYIKSNGISYKNKIHKENKKIKLLYNWNISSSRKKEISIIKNKLTINVRHISDSLIDWSFTHKSFINSNKIKNISHNSNLTSLGARIFNFYLTVYLININKYTDDYKRFNQNVGQLLKRDFIDELIKLDFTCVLHLLRTVKGFDNKEILIQDIFKSLFACFMLQNYIFKNITITEVEEEIYKTIDRYYNKKVISDHIDFSSWMNSFSEILGIESKIKIIDEIGNSNNAIFIGELVVKLSQYGIKDYRVVKEARSKKELKFILCNDFYNFIFLNYNLNNFIEENDEKTNIFLRDLINNFIKKNGFYYANINILGGLCLDGWNSKNVENIIFNLKHKQLYNELISLYNCWCELYGEKVEEVKYILKKYKIDYLIIEDKMDEDGLNTNDIANSVSKSYEEKQKNELEKNDISDSKRYEEKIKVNLKKNNSNISIPTFYEENQKVNLDKKNDFTNKMIEKSEKDVTIFTKLYFFNDNKCPFCKGDLEDITSVIQIEKNNKFKFIESEVCSCTICGIRGVDKNKTNNLTSNGLKYHLYLGSPSYYSSTVIHKKNIKVLGSSKKKKKRTLSLESLEKQLAIKKEIGKKGELLVLELEKNILIESGRSDLAKKVTLVSEKDCTAGFDIISFFEDGAYKYIEVKTSTSNIKDFYFSSNEYSVAKELGNSYYIYKVSNLSKDPYINKINNPVKKIEGGELILTPTQYYVTEK